MADAKATPLAAFHSVPLTPAQENMPKKSARLKNHARIAKVAAALTLEAFARFLTAAAELSVADAALAVQGLPAGLQPAADLLLAALRGAK